MALTWLGVLAHRSRVTFSAPAKINLSLSVLGKRSDGFHEIESLMVPLSLSDELTFTLGDATGLTLTCSDPTLPTGDDNLIIRAARAFFRAAALPEQAEIFLKKQIPHGAGLGGGSSDAATTLLALNELHGSPLPIAALYPLAAEIGSDVPFFLCRSAAICRGRGEIVEPTLLATRLSLLLVKPAFGIPTPWAYQHWSASKALPGISYEPIQLPWATLVNDLERPVFEKHLFVATLRQWLREQAEVEGALMSGSGSTCFAILKDAKSGPALQERARTVFGKGCRTILCETI